MGRLSRARQFGEQVFAEFSEKNVTFMAAGIAYNAFISLAPVLLILLLVVATVGGGLEARVVAIAERSLPGPVADIVRRVFAGDAASPGASIVGLVALVWGTLKVFRGLDTAFSEIYETTTKNSFVDKLVDGLVVMVAMVVAILATIGVTAAFAAFSDTIPFVGLLTPLVLVAGLVVAFLPMFYRFPDTDVDWDHVLPGAIFAAVGWAAFQGLFQVYLSFSDGGSGSVFGGVVVVITWLYFSGLVLLVGAVVNAVLGEHTSGKAGGVGQGASAFETERETEMDRDEFAAYLEELRESLTGHYRGMRPRTGDGGEGLRVPDGPIEVVEQTAPDEDGEGRRWEVAFRWRAADEGEAEESGATAD